MRAPFFTIFVHLAFEWVPTRCFWIFILVPSTCYTLVASFGSCWFLGPKEEDQLHFCSGSSLEVDWRYSFVLNHWLKAYRAVLDVVLRTFGVKNTPHFNTVPYIWLVGDQRGLGEGYSHILRPTWPQHLSSATAAEKESEVKLACCGPNSTHQVKVRQPPFLR